MAAKGGSLGWNRTHTVCFKGGNRPGGFWRWERERGALGPNACLALLEYLFCPFLYKLSLSCYCMQSHFVFTSYECI